MIYANVYKDVFLSARRGALSVAPVGLTIKAKMLKTTPGF